MQYRDLPTAFHGCEIRNVFEEGGPESPLVRRSIDPWIREISRLSVSKAVCIDVGERRLSKCGTRAVLVPFRFLNPPRRSARAPDR